jgi:hypothetical protein
MAPITTRILTERARAQLRSEMRIQLCGEAA